jgi:hypothetical protein
MYMYVFRPNIGLGSSPCQTTVQHERTETFVYFFFRLY